MGSGRWTGPAKRAKTDAMDKVMINRRIVLGGTAALLLGGAARRDQGLDATALRTQLAALEVRSRGRLGVAVRDTASRATIVWRGDEAFALCSTFKWLLVAAILARVDRGQERLDRLVRVQPKDLLAHSPVSARFVGTAGATVAQLCEATITQSDNAAANLLLPAIGGPAGLTRFLRRAGDHATRLDRIEPWLSEARPGDRRDTTTPRAMLDDLAHFLLGPALRPASRALLTGWLIANRTGDHRLRAGLPRQWRVGDKTGTGGHGSSNDVAIVWPTTRAPLLITSYLTQSPLDDDARNAIHAGVAAAIVAALR